MSGLLGSMVAGAVGGYAKGAAEDIDNTNKMNTEFNLRKALLDAEVEKQGLLKEMGYQADQQHATQERTRVTGLLQSGRDAIKPAADAPSGYDANAPKQYDQMSESEKLIFDANTLKNNGDLKGYDEMIARAKNVAPAASKGFDSVKLDDGSVFSFNKDTGGGKIVLQGDKALNVPKNEIELAWKEADGDPKKAGEILVQQKSRIAAASRPPTKQSDDDEAYADWKKKPENAGKGRDDYAKEKSGWGKEDTESTSTAVTMDDTGQPMQTVETTTRRGRAKPKGKADPILDDPLGLRKR